jgi:mannose-6-phosphate isomerase-like protein (cupin superfamily)
LQLWSQTRILLSMTTLTARTDLWWPYGPGGSHPGRYTFLVSGAETGGRLAQMHVTDRRGAATPLHVHNTDETWFVVRGSLELVIGEERVHAGPGDLVLGPAGVPHASLVTSEEAEFLVTVAGAGDAGPEGHGIEGFFREVAIPVVDGEEPPAPRMPDERAFAERMPVYGVELLGPPPFAP